MDWQSICGITSLQISFWQSLVAKRTVKLGCKLPIPLARLRLVGSWRLECTLTRFVTWLLSSLKMLNQIILGSERQKSMWKKNISFFGAKENPAKTCDEIFWPTKFFFNLPFKNIETLESFETNKHCSRPQPEIQWKIEMDLPKFTLGVHGLKGLFAFLRSKLFLQRITVFKPCTCALFLAALWWDGADSRGSSLCATETQQVWHYGTSAWRYPPRGHLPKSAEICPR